MIKLCTYPIITCWDSVTYCLLDFPVRPLLDLLMVDEQANKNVHRCWCYNLSCNKKSHLSATPPGLDLTGPHLLWQE